MLHFWAIYFWAAVAVIPGEPPPELVVQRFLDAFNKKDLTAMLALTTEEVAWLSIKGNGVVVETEGQEALKKSMAGYFTALPTARSSAEKVAVHGDYVTFSERVSWQSKDGERSQASLAIYQIQNGKVHKVWYYPATR